MTTDLRRDPASLCVTSLPGIGPVRAACLARLGLRSVRDVLLFVPRRLETCEEVSVLERIAEFTGERVRVRGTVTGLSLYRRGWRRTVLRVRIEDNDGHLDLLYFNQAWMRKRFERGDELCCEGLIVDSKGPAMSAPRLVADESTPVEPQVVYPLTEGIGQEFLRKLCRGVCEEYASALEEPLDPTALRKLGLPDLPDAVRAVHRPQDRDSFLAARRRLALEALLRLQARLAERHAGRLAGRATPVSISAEAMAQLTARFPADFTAGQNRVVGEIAADLARPIPMCRLLQGDVGSGKTWVAAWAAAVVAQAGKQVALMAPTELLAEQHALGLAPLFESLGLRSALLTGSRTAEQNRRVRADLASGRVTVAIGTHALFSSSTSFRDLALVVIDEQHRFGVAQRKRLFDKGRDVHVLLMTATPIPRTLALTIYGDMDTSLLSDRPPGRGSVSTCRVQAPKLEAMDDFLIRRMDAGERVFWVAPRIDGEAGAAAAHERWVRVLKGSANGVELVHGRLPALERARRMERFRRGEVRLLVGTTIIEVGVDVPEATVMVIDGAHQLGLAQLHQIRGRVGRGSAASWCFLVGEDLAAERMELLSNTSDGFQIAELDLRQRGMGSLTGLRQAGVNDEGLDSPENDLPLLLLARDAVRRDARLRARYAALRPDARTVPAGA